MEEVARPASRTFLPVTDDSDALRRELAETGLGAESLRPRASALMHELALAGTMTRTNERRAELDLHLRYWAAMRRVATGGSDKAPSLEEFDKAIRDLPPDKMFAEATTGAGLSQFEVRGFQLDLSADTRAERFLAEGCRLVEGQLAGLRARELSIWESGLFGVKLIDFEIDGLLQGQYAAAASTTLKGAAREADLAKTLARDVEISLRAERALFDDADMANTQNRNLEELLPSDVSRWADERSAARLTDCVFGSSSFVRAALQGVAFHNCDLGDANFTAAEVSGASFHGCTVRGRAMVHHDLDSATDAGSAAVD
jgi:hypothetical protein